MATRIVSRHDGTVISRNGKKADEDENKINNRLAQAAYQAVTPAKTVNTGVTGAGNTGYHIAAGSTVGRPTNFAGGDAAYLNYLQNESGIKAANLAYNTGANGMPAKLQQGGLDAAAYGALLKPGNFTPQAHSTGLGDVNASAAYQQAKNAQEAALQEALSTIGIQKPAINRQYDDLAKQAYSSYQKGESALPYQTQNTATGAKDNLALQALLGFENTRANISQSRLDALAALDAQIAQAKASGAFDLADMEQEHAMMQAKFLREAQQEATAQEQKMQEMAFAQEIALAKAAAPTTSKALPAAPTRMDAETALKLYSQGEIGKEELSGILSGYIGAFGLPQRQLPAPKNAEGLPLANTGKTGWVVIPGLGRVALAELPRLVQSGEVTQVIQGDTVRYVKAR
jgi:hypothetical protein